MAGNYSSVLWLSDVDKDDSDSVGKSAARLGEMTRAGFPVPQGFIITNHAYQHFLHENNLTTRINSLLSTVHYEDVTSLMQISNHIKKLIMEAQLSPLLVKEIDSAYRKFGGFFHHPPVMITVSQKKDTKIPAVLNVQGEANIILKIREIWAALFSPPELRARHKINADHFTSEASIVIQKMILPDTSGSILTQNPITHNKDSMLIEAVFGFSDHILIPDHYEISKTDFAILSKKTSKQDYMFQLHDKHMEKVAVHSLHQKAQKVQDNKILDLAVMAKKLEKQYYFPQIISWAIEKNKIYFLNSKQFDPPPHPENGHEHATPSKYLPLLLKATPASPGLKKGPVRIVRHAKELTYVMAGDIVVTNHTSPEFFPAMKKAAAIITEQGGRVSQAAHVSRELGIPAIIGAERATQLLHAGAIVTVNGTTGEVFGGSTHTVPHNGISTATKLYVNITQHEHTKVVAHEHIDGVGYFQTDLLIKELGIHPQKLVNESQDKVYTDKLVRQLEEVCKAFAPRPVVFSFTDLLTPELRQLDGGKLYEPVERNPLIGFRGTYKLIHSSKLFSMELHAVKQIRNAGINNLWLTIPFVRTVRELEEVKRILNAAGLGRTPTLRLWMQVATPANLISLDTFIMAGIDGVSIDLDSIISLLLGVDKQNSEVVKEFNPHDPAVLWILEQAVKICHKHHVPISISGQTPSQYPSLLEKFVNWGVTSVSVEPNAIHSARKEIMEAERKRIENVGKH
jgi:pyruvate,water dikinase